jgi:inositol oxygenase
MRLLIDQNHDYPHLLDGSQLLRHEESPHGMELDKPVSKFRDYTIDTADPLKERVRRTYHEMHAQQTVDFVKSKHEKWLKFNHFEATILEALDKLNDLVDESDPDIDLPNSVHAFQTAERIREQYPNDEWFQLTGLIHDLGKVMAFYDEPQWAVTGDTFPVGCQPQKSIVYIDTSFVGNPDLKNEKYNTLYGMYEPNCGLDQLTMSWGHDEYLYQVLKHNGAKLPDEAFYMIRFHSFYPYHHGGDYRHLANEKDAEMFKWIKEFNVFDLYTKSTKIPDVEALKPYYQGLIDKYIPGVLKF